MGQAVWQAVPDGRYWIDILIGNMPLPLMIDLGLVDASGRVGFQLEAQTYAQLKSGGQLSQLQFRKWRDASGNTVLSESGLATAQLLDPVTLTGIGPSVHLYVNEGGVGLPNRVGVSFFRSLRGCTVVWDLDLRRFCVQYP